MKATLKAFVLAAAIAAATMAAPTAHAGRSCDAKKPTAQTIERGMTLAQRTLEALDAEHARTGAQVVVLARAGQDLSKYGVRYSHLGLAYRAEAGEWRVLHKLNHCGTADAALYRQGLGEFFMDDPWRYEAAWAVLTPEVQARLLPVLREGRKATTLHHRPYSMVSYAWGRRYQQSNQWAIEMLASAMLPDTSDTTAPVAAARERAQGWLMARGYQPAVLRLGPLTRLGGRMTAANVAFDDHPDSKRFSDRIETVTVDSVFDWLPRAGLGSAPATLRQP